MGASRELTGEVLDGRYRLLALVGEGGMAYVYRGEHVGLGNRRAVKMMQDDRARDPEAAARFLREARMAAKLRHENIMEVIDVGEHRGIPYYVMEWLDGEDLAQILVREKKFPWGRTRDFALQICAGLDYAHRQGVVHRDMKPENCLVLRRRGEEQLKILDFGIAKDFLSTETALTATGEVMGTVYYMSPEQMHGRGDHQIDVYAVGIMLYAMLAGRLPYTGETQIEVITKVLMNYEPEPLRYLNPEVTPEIEALVARAMDREPARRFPSMAELRSALLALEAPVAERGSPAVARAVSASFALRETRLATPVLGLPGARELAQAVDDDPRAFGDPSAPGDPGDPGDPGEPGGELAGGTLRMPTYQVDEVEDLAETRPLREREASPRRSQIRRFAPWAALVAVVGVGLQRSLSDRSPEPAVEESASAVTPPGPEAGTDTSVEGPESAESAGEPEATPEEIIKADDADPGGGEPADEIVLDDDAPESPDDKSAEASPATPVKTKVKSAPPKPRPKSFYQVIIRRLQKQLNSNEECRPKNLEVSLTIRTRREGNVFKGLEVKDYGELYGEERQDCVQRVLKKIRVGEEFDDIPSEFPVVIKPQR